MKRSVLFAAIAILLAVLAVRWSGIRGQSLNPTSVAKGQAVQGFRVAGSSGQMGVEELSSAETLKPAPPAYRTSQSRGVVRDERAILMSREAMEPYETILDALGLPQDRLQRLKELIVEWQESAGDAAELSKDYRLDPANASTARAQAEGAFDDEIADVVGHPHDATVLEMLSLTPQLANINGSVGRDLVAAGVPLSADQSLQLAEAYKETYAVPAGGAGPSSGRTAGFDPQTGLAAVDRQVLMRASRFLTSSQMEIVQTSLAKKSAAYAMASR
jgi:hypothetical protein